MLAMARLMGAGALLGLGLATATTAATPADSAEEARERAINAAVGKALLGELQTPDYVEQRLLHPRGVEAGDDANFGVAVDIERTIAVVGAIGDDGPVPDQGAVYVFVRNGSQWVQHARLVAPDGASGDLFGHAVAASFNTVVVGAPFADGPGRTDRGAAYVFVRHNDDWTLQAKFMVGDADARFGHAVDILGNRIVVGARHGVAQRGAAYTFERFDNTSWAGPEPLLPATAPAPGDQFGYSVAIGNHEIVVGAVGDDAAGTDAGAAYAFHHDGARWVATTRLQPEGLAAGALFGFSVDLSNRHALVGALFDQVEGMAAGAAYLYRAGGSAVPQWQLRSRLTAPDAHANMRFGFDVALQVVPSVYSRLFVTAQQANSRRGAVYELRGLRGLPPEHHVRLAPVTLGVADAFGSGVATYGPDFIIGAPGVDFGPPPAETVSIGAAYFFRESRVFRDGFDG